MDRSRANVRAGTLAGEEPVAFGRHLSVVIAQEFKEQGAQDAVTFLLPLALDTDAHSFRVDIGLSQACHLCDTQARPVASGHDRLMLNELGSFKDGHDLFSAQHQREPFGQFWAGWVRDDFRTLHYFSVEELKGGDIALLGGGTGVHPDQARVAVGNGRGPWWNAGAWHMNRAVPNATLRKMGLISLVDAHRRLACPA